MSILQCLQKIIIKWTSINLLGANHLLIHPYKANHLNDKGKAGLSPTWKLICFDRWTRGPGQTVKARQRSDNPWNIECINYYNHWINTIYNIGVPTSLSPNEQIQWKILTVYKNHIWHILLTLPNSSKYLRISSSLVLVDSPPINIFLVEVTI